jgi:HlyD family secretion protein
MKLKLGTAKRNLLIVIGLLVIGLAGTYLYYNRNTNGDDYLTARIEKGDIRNTVAATGTLQAVRTVPVGAQVSGIIQKLYVDFNDEVHTGDLIAELDPVQLQQALSQQQASLEQSKANLANAKGRLLAAEAEVNTQRAGVSSAKANLAALKAQRDDAERLLQRQRGLAESGVLPERDLEATRANFSAADARYNQAKAQLEQAIVNEQNAANAGLEQAKAQVKASEAQVQEAEVRVRLAEANLGYTKIYSPIDGVVVSRDVNDGQTVASNFSAPTLFTIATDLANMQVIAAIDQADIGMINQDNKVSFTVDAFPGEAFQGTINQIRLNALNVSNVVTYNVVVDVKNPDKKLKPGMTADLTFAIAERDNVLKLPNAALRFRPPEITNQQIREMLLDASGNNPAQARRPEAAGTPGAEASQAKSSGSEQQPGAATEERGRRRRRDQQSGEAGNEQGQRRRRQRDQQPGTAGDGTADASGARREGGRMTGFAPSTAVMVEGQWRVVWVLGPDNKPQPRRIQIGITDGTSTEILRGDLKEGESVITMRNISADSGQNRQTPPGFGGSPGGRGFGGGGRRR